MKTVTVKLKNYILSAQEIAQLAEEFYGKVLQADGTANTIDLGFDGEHEKHGATFQETLDSTFKKRAKKKTL